MLQKRLNMLDSGYGQNFVATQAIFWFSTPELTKINQKLSFLIIATFSGGANFYQGVVQPPAGSRLDIYFVTCCKMLNIQVQTLTINQNRNIMQKVVS